jgi:hypothetical protein
LTIRGNYSSVPVPDLVVGLSFQLCNLSNRAGAQSCSPRQQMMMKPKMDEKHIHPLRNKMTFSGRMGLVRKILIERPRRRVDDHLHHLLASRR